MFKHLKFTRDQADKIIFCSDLHLNQGKQFLVEGRSNFLDQGNLPFATPEGHDEWIWSQLEKYADGEHILFNLGDQVFRDGNGSVFDRLTELNFKEHYILYGNHCSGLKQTYKEAVYYWHGVLNYEDLEFEIYPLKWKNVTFVGHDLKIFIGKQEIHMSHFPKRIWDNMSDKRKCNEHGHLSGIKPSIHLSGHSHASDPSRNVDHKAGKCLDVGVENAITYGDKFCFTYSEIESIMETKQVEVLDHHKGSENPS